MGTILFVDDDSMSLQLMTRAVELLGHDVWCDPSPRRALRWAAENHPVLILVDLRMMEMNGLDFIRALKTQDETREIPALIFSASIDPRDRVSALEAGADDYLLKPLHITDLKNIISRLYPQ